jgi:transaldolase
MKISKLDQLKAMTVVVADTGDIDEIKKYSPIDATTNPSLLFKAAQLPGYSTNVSAALSWGYSQATTEADSIAASIDKLAVDIGCEILKIIPGRISTEVDSRLSFNKQASIEKARKLIALYAAQGIAPGRILIKLAATWEGIQAAEVLEKDGINCNLTLLFNFNQAAACADAGVFLISPFVGRILDWYKAKDKTLDYLPGQEPGVLSVKKIYSYYKQHHYPTLVMGASFRNSGEIEALAGCDRLTISPSLLAELAADKGELKRQLDPDIKSDAIVKQPQSEPVFRWGLNEDAMATDKLAEGIRNFTADTVKLENLLKQLPR